MEAQDTATTNGVTAALTGDAAEKKRFGELREKLAGENPGTKVFVCRMNDDDGGYVRCICRSMTPDEWQRFKKEAATDKDRALKSIEAQEKAFRAGVLYPKGDELADLCRKLPGLPMTFGALVLDKSGMSDSAEVEKL